MKKICLSAVSAFLFFLSHFGFANALTVKLDPATVSLPAVGTKFTINVLISGMTDLGGFEFDVNYDPSGVKVASSADVTLGSFLGSTGRTASPLGPTINNTTGKITFGGFSFGANAGPNGSGTLATIAFTVQSQKAGTLDLANVTVTDTDANPITVNSLGDSTLSVCGSSGALQFSLANYSVNENGGIAIVAVTRTGGSCGAVGVHYATSNGGAAASSDYTAKSGDLSWANGDAANKTFTVSITNDNVDENDETLNLTLSLPTGGATLGAMSIADLTIIDDDANLNPGTLQFDSSSYRAGESAGTKIITVSRMGGSSGGVSVHYATSNGTATAGNDYTETSGTLNWADGDTSNKTFSVPIINDAIIEGNETVLLSLNNPQGGAVIGAQSTATLTITDNDGCTITVLSPNGGESWQAGTNHNITWSSFGCSGNVQLRYSINGGTNWKGIASSTPNDGSFSWTAPNDLSKQVRVEIMDLGSNKLDISNGNFTITELPSLASAVDNLKLVFTTGRASSWFWQKAIKYYDGDAAQSGSIGDSQASWMQTSVTGPGAFSFYWKVSSEPNCDFLRFTIDDAQMDAITGNTGWTKRTFSIPSGTHTMKWRYTKDADGTEGSDCGWVDKVEWIKSAQTLSYAVDNPSLIFMSGGNSDWFWQNITSYFGNDAARSGNIDDRQNVWMQTTVTGPGMLTFYWKISSQSNSDFLRFYIDSVSKSAMTGKTEWIKKSFSIPSGKHTLKWRYSKDSAGTDGADCGWLDKVSFIPQ